VEVPPSFPLSAWIPPRRYHSSPFGSQLPPHPLTIPQIDWKTRGRRNFPPSPLPFVLTAFFAGWPRLPFSHFFSFYSLPRAECQCLNCPVGPCPIFPSRTAGGSSACVVFFFQAARRRRYFLFLSRGGTRAGAFILMSFGPVVPCDAISADSCSLHLLHILVHKDGGFFSRFDQERTVFSRLPTPFPTIESSWGCCACEIAM